MKALSLLLAFALTAHVAQAQLQPINRQQILDYARTAVGSPYVWGGSNWDPANRGFGGADCSGLVGKAWCIDRWVPYRKSYHPYSTAHFINTPGPSWYECGIGNLVSGDAIVYRYADDSGGHTYIFEGGDPWGSHRSLEAASSSIGIVNRWRSLPSSYSRLKGIRRLQLVESHQVSDIIVECEDGAPTFAFSGTASTSGYDSYAPFLGDGSVTYAWVQSNSNDVATFRPSLPALGLYEILVTCNQSSPNVAGVRVTSWHAGGSETAIWNQATAGNNEWLPIGGPFLMRAGSVDRVEWRDSQASPRDGSSIFRADATMFRLSNEVVVDGIGGTTGTFANLTDAVTWLGAHRSLDPDVIRIVTNRVTEPGPLQIALLDDLVIEGDADHDGTPCTVVVPPGPVAGFAYPCGVMLRLPQQARWQMRDLVFVPPFQGAGALTGAAALVIDNQRPDGYHNGYALELERVTLTGSLSGDVAAAADGDLRTSCTRWGGGAGVESGVMILRTRTSAGDGLRQSLIARDLTIVQGNGTGLALNAGATDVRLFDRCRIAWNSGNGLLFADGREASLQLAGGHDADRIVIADNDRNGIEIDAAGAAPTAVAIAGCNIVNNGAAADQAGLLTRTAVAVVEDCILAANSRYNWYHLAAGSASSASAVTVRRCTFHDAIYPTGDTSPVCVSSSAVYNQVHLTDCILSGGPETPGNLEGLYVSTAATGTTVSLDHCDLVLAGPYALTGDGVRQGAGQVSQVQETHVDPEYLSQDPRSLDFLAVSSTALFAASSTGDILHGGGRAAVPPPATVTEFGAGCPGAGGFVPAIVSAGGLPFPGNGAFTVYLVSANAGVPAALLVGASDSFSTMVGTTLPIALDAFGWPGCQLLVDPNPVAGWFTTISWGAGNGFTFVTLPIPAIPQALSGQRLFLQWLILDSQATGGLCLSNGLRLGWN